MFASLSLRRFRLIRSVDSLSGRWWHYNIFPPCESWDRRPGGCKTRSIRVRRCNVMKTDNAKGSHMTRPIKPDFISWNRRHIGQRSAALACTNCGLASHVNLKGDKTISKEMAETLLCFWCKEVAENK